MGRRPGGQACEEGGGSTGGVSGGRNLRSTGEHHTVRSLQTVPAQRPPAISPFSMGAEESWHEIWRERIECWWVTLPSPSQAQLAGCMGAVALHLGGRFDAMMRGRIYPRAAVGALGVGGGAAEGECESTAEGLSLPQFPEVGRFEFRVPPVPRLLPSWERLHALVGGGGAEDGRAEGVVSAARGGGGVVR